MVDNIRRDSRRLVTYSVLCFIILIIILCCILTSIILQDIICNKHIPLFCIVYDILFMLIYCQVIRLVNWHVFVSNLPRNAILIFFSFT